MITLAVSSPEAACARSAPDGPQTCEHDRERAREPDEGGDDPGRDRLQLVPYVERYPHGAGQPRARSPGSSARASGSCASARGWSLSSLAARAGLGKATLSEIESGRRNPTLETLYAIAAQLQIGLSELLTERRRSRRRAPDVVRGRAVEASLVAAYRDDSATTEIYRLRIHPGRLQTSPGHGPGVIEHLFVTAGTVSVGPLGSPTEVACGRRRQLGVGDARTATPRSATRSPRPC